MLFAQRSALITAPRRARHPNGKTSCSVELAVVGHGLQYTLTRCDWAAGEHACAHRTGTSAWCGARARAGRWSDFLKEPKKIQRATALRYAGSSHRTFDVCRRWTGSRAKPSRFEGLLARTDRAPCALEARGATRREPWAALGRWEPPDAGCSSAAGGDEWRPDRGGERRLPHQRAR